MLRRNGAGQETMESVRKSEGSLGWKNRKPCVDGVACGFAASFCVDKALECTLCKVRCIKPTNLVRVT